MLGEGRRRKRLDGSRGKEGRARFHRRRGERLNGRNSEKEGDNKWKKRGEVKWNNKG